MVLGQIHYLIEEKASNSDVNSTSPLFGLEYLALLCTVFNSIKSFFSDFWFFLLAQLHPVRSKVCWEKMNSEPETSHHESEANGSIDNENLDRNEVKMVMERLRLSCSSESEELHEQYGSNELSEIFEDQEPSLHEVKQAFDVFDENKDGFIDALELKKVLLILGLEEAREIENCHKMIRNFDENQDGRIDFNEFVKIMEQRLC